MRSVWPSDVESGATRILVSVDFAARVRGARAISQTTAINAARNQDGQSFEWGGRSASAEDFGPTVTAKWRFAKARPEPVLR